jgi:hypothetical protein
LSAPKLKVLEGQLVAEQPTPERKGLPAIPKRINDLQSLKHDTLRMYRAARRGEIDSSELSRWMFAIGKVGDIIEKADIEPRLDALEQRLLALTDMLARQAR